MKNELKAMFTEHWKYLAVNAACELQLFDKIFQGQNTLKLLIQMNNWDMKSLMNLLEYLCTDGYIEELENQTYKVNAKGDLLREANPEGLYYACLNWPGEHLTAWQNLSYTIETGRSSFESRYGQPYFDFLDENPLKLEKYHKAMFEYAIDDYKNLPDIIDFSIHKSIMDVGGGYGAAITLIKEKYPNTNCMLFDLEQVIEGVINHKIEKIGGNFFEEIPAKSEVIILSRVLHDWKDAKVKEILQNCYKALPSNGTLYVIENCTDKIETKLSLLSLNMTLMCQSYERRINEYIELCKAEGFIFYADKQLNQLQTILIFRK
jgi:C-methyltransferase